MLRDSSTAACIDKANETTAPIDARIQDLSANWNPSGYYETAAIRQGIASVQAALSQAFTVLNQTDMSCRLAPGCSFPTWGDRYRALLDAVNRSQAYIDAADAADSAASAAFKTAYVIAIDFKRWAIQSLSAASDAIGDATTIACIMPWWASAIVTAVKAVSAAADVLAGIYGVAKSVVDAAISTGAAVGTTVKAAFNFVNWIASSAPLLVGVAVLAFGVPYVWKRRDAIRRRFPTMRSVLRLP